MKDFILKHPIITLLLVEELCSTVKTCVLGKRYYTCTNSVTNAGATAVEAVVEKLDERLTETEENEEKETVVTGFCLGN